MPTFHWLVYMARKKITARAYFITRNHLPSTAIILRFTGFPIPSTLQARENLKKPGRPLILFYQNQVCRIIQGWLQNTEKQLTSLHLILPGLMQEIIMYLLLKILVMESIQKSRNIFLPC